MRIQVTEVTHDRGGALWVVFRCVAGGATARWLGRTHLPNPGKVYDVELDVEAAADPSTNLRTVATNDTQISSDGELVILRVVVESVDEDGMACLRLADDCLVMMDATGAVTVGNTVEIRVPQGSLSVTVTGTL